MWNAFVIRIGQVTGYQRVALSAEGAEMKVADPPRLIVVDADEMYDDDFVRHFDLRHKDQLGGLDGILLTDDEDTINLYREFHFKLHNYAYLFPFAELNHDHGESEE
jgi:hypothetical protein